MFNNLSPFQQARWKLTLWYVGLWTLLIVGFTYLTLDAKRSTFVRVYRIVDSAQPGGKQVQEFADTFAEYNRRFQERLVLFDLFLFLGGAWIAYWLSGKTLQPIEAMVEEQSAFAADVSHGLRTPLTTINLELEAYSRSHLNTSKGTRSLLVSIQEEVFSMTYLVEGLLALVRTRTDPLRTPFLPVSLNEVVINAGKRMLPIAQAKGQELTVEAKVKVNVLGNAEHLLQVIVILIDNAIKYSGLKRQIKVKVVKQLSFAQVVVADNGIGIPKGELAHIFKRYYRGKQKTKGTGLGLAIAQKIVDAHGGTIRVKSIQGSGTTFTISLPVKQ